MNTNFSLKLILILCLLTKSNSNTQRNYSSYTIKPPTTFHQAGYQNFPKVFLHSSWSTYNQPIITANLQCFNLAGYPTKFITTTSSWYLSPKDRNKIIKCSNGNIKSIIRITHWNAGSTHWVNKQTEIQNIIDTRKPDILLLSEANIFAENPSHTTCIPGYNLVTSRSLDTLGYTRMAALVRDRINVEIEGKWMTQDVASIWLKFIKKKGSKEIIYMWYI